MNHRSVAFIMVFAAWLGAAAIADAQEVQPRAKTPPAPRVVPREAPEGETAQKPSAPTSAVAPAPAPLIQEKSAAEMLKSAAPALAMPDLSCTLILRSTPTKTIALSSGAPGPPVTFDPAMTKLSVETQVRNVGKGVFSGNGVGWLKVRVNGVVALSQPVPFGSLETGMTGWEKGGPFQFDLLDQEFAMAYDIVAEMDVGVLNGNDELNVANNACDLQAQVIRPVDNQPFQTF